MAANARGVGIYQPDGLQNIFGIISALENSSLSGVINTATGAFEASGPTAVPNFSSRHGTSGRFAQATFDASRVARTSDFETRVASAAVGPFIHV